MQDADVLDIASGAPEVTTKESLWGLHVPHNFVVWLKNEWSFIIETMHVRP